MSKKTFIQTIQRSICKSFVFTGTDQALGQSNEGTVEGENHCNAQYAKARVNRSDQNRVHNKAAKPKMKQRIRPIVKDSENSCSNQLNEKEQQSDTATIGLRSDCRQQHRSSRPDADTQNHRPGNREADCTGHAECLQNTDCSRSTLKDCSKHCSNQDADQRVGEAGHQLNENSAFL